VRKRQKDVENESGLVPYLEAARADVQSFHLESEGFWYSQKRTEIAFLHSLDPKPAFTRCPGAAVRYPE
jgi:hypothetical protein